MSLCDKGDDRKRRRLHDHETVETVVKPVIYNVEVEKEVERALSTEDYAKAREYLTERSKMFGREQQKKELTAFITTNLNIGGASLFVCGPSGIGKTLCLQTVIRELKLKAVTVNLSISSDSKLTDVLRHAFGIDDWMDRAKTKRNILIIEEMDEPRFARDVRILLQFISSSKLILIGTGNSDGRYYQPPTIIMRFPVYSVDDLFHILEGKFPEEFAKRLFDEKTKKFWASKVVSYCSNGDFRFAVGVMGQCIDLAESYKNGSRLSLSLIQKVFSQRNRERDDMVNMLTPMGKNIYLILKEKFSEGQEFTMNDVRMIYTNLTKYDHPDPGLIRGIMDSLNDTPLVRITKPLTYQLKSF